MKPDRGALLDQFLLEWAALVALLWVAGRAL